MIKIDIIELKILAVACIPPVPIARACFWQKMIDEHYNKLTEHVRKDLFECITRQPNFDLNNEDCQLFYARYNPDNQYLVTTDYEGEKGQHKAFLMNDRYHLSKSSSIQEQFIFSVEKLN
jgi:hypothetical protein